MGEIAETQTPSIRTAAMELLTMLCARYPETFTHEGEPPRPLAIGTGDRLIAELALDPAVVHDAMRLYTRRRAYQNALAQPGAMRVDLDGLPTAPVAPEHQAAARPRRPAPPGQCTRHPRPLCPSPSTNGKDSPLCLSPQP